MASRRLAGSGDASILAHLDEISLPEVFAEKVWQALDLTDANDLCHRLIHGSRVGLGPENAGRLFKDLLIKHKIRALHAHSVS